MVQKRRRRKEGNGKIRGQMRRERKGEISTEEERKKTARVSRILCAC